MMIGEGAVRIAIERDQININAREERQHGGAADAVSGIRHDLQAALNPDPGERFFNVRVDRIDDFNFAGLFRRDPVACLSAASNVLDLFGKERNPRNHHLEAVPFRRVMGPRHRNAGTVSKMLRCVIKNGRRHRAGIEHLDAR